VPRQTIAELREEAERLRVQVENIRHELMDSLVLVLDMLDRVTETVAHRLRTLKIENDEPLPDDDF
jgi:hypothetical protein